VTATFLAVGEDHCLGLAAQLAFFALLAIFPALLCLVALVGYFPIQDVIAELMLLISPVAPPAFVELLADQLREVAGDGRAGLATAAIAGALWSSSAAMVAIIETLNHAYRVTEWRPWWKRRLVAVALTLALGAFATASLLLIMVGPDVVRRVAGQVGIHGVVTPVWQLVRWPAMFALVVFAIDLVYHFAPNRQHRWAWITPGALVATGLWIVSSFVFKYYVTQIGTYNVTYGAIGGVIVVLLWLYLSSLAILIGAEVNSAIADLRETPPAP
jgi:membrane protein